MITDKKIKELKKMLRSGVPAGEVKQQLMFGFYLFLRQETLMNLIVILFSIFLFYQYFRETQRTKTPER